MVLTGAGISAESGIRTFRAEDGLWEEHRVEDVATPGAFARDPSLVHRFYNARRQQLVGSGDTPPVQPNEAHVALARFEAHLNELGPDFDFFLVTQNVDDLHERAGSRAVCHMHGELTKMRCRTCERIHDWRTNCDPGTTCPACNSRGSLRPHIVWFGEIPLFMEEIAVKLARCDVFVSIGTSGNVYPAAGLFQLAQRQGAHTVELNLEPSKNASLFDEGYYGPASEVVPRYLRDLARANQP